MSLSYLGLLPIATALTGNTEIPRLNPLEQIQLEQRHYPWALACYGQCSSVFLSREFAVFVIRLQTRVHLILRPFNSVLCCSTLKTHIVFCVIYFNILSYFWCKEWQLRDARECLQVSWYVLIKSPKKSENWVLFRKRNAPIFFSY